MDQKTFEIAQNKEKASLLHRDFNGHDQSRNSRRRNPGIKGAIIVAVVFLIWWSYTAVPDLFGPWRHSNVAHEYFGQDVDFDDVSLSLVND